jgi:hypothetical protein
MTLGAGVDAKAFQALELRTFAGPYDPSQPIPAGAYEDHESLAAITFPYKYVVGGGVGSSTVGSWQLVAWLSARTAPQASLLTGPDPGDASCSVAYTVGGCGPGQGGYCGVTPNVDCALTLP